MAAIQQTPTVVLGVCGSIAAFKAAEITSRLARAGVDVHVVLTRHATDFITPLTFQILSRNPVTTTLADENPSLRPGHIELADRANLLLVAPATANTIAKLAIGLADDPLTAIALACTAPVLIAPAMNGKMWLHPATSGHVATLKSRNTEFIGPDQGMLACGYSGIGRLWNPTLIADRALEILGRPAHDQ